MITFIDLPAELRNIIYDELLVTNTHIGLLATSKLVHEEVASYFYQHNAFTVSLPPATHNQQGATILPLMPDKYLRHLRYLTIDICLTTSNTLNSTLDCAQRLMSLAATGATISSLTLNLSSNTSRILATRIDDYVLHASHPLVFALQHILSCNSAQYVVVEMNGVWFAPGLASQLHREFDRVLQIRTSAFGSSPERALLGQSTETYLRGLGLNSEDIDALRYSSSSVSESPCITSSLPPSLPSSLPSPLSSALSELDHFSPIDFLEDPVDTHCSPKIKGEKSGSMLAGHADAFDMDLFDPNDAGEGSGEELNEEDDVEDADMENVHDFDAIIDNLEDVAQTRVNEADVYYLANFAPGMLGRRSGGAV